jgi:hypothetical protein
LDGGGSVCDLGDDEIANLVELQQEKIIKITRGDLPLIHTAHPDFRHLSADTLDRYSTESGQTAQY